MSSTASDIHKSFLQACLEGDLNHVLQLAYYQTDVVQSLIQGEMPCLSNNDFPGNFKPGEYIHAATVMKHTEIVAQLINLGVDPSLDSRFGTPLDIACKNGCLDILRLIHTHGLDVHPEGKDIWNSGIYIACQEGCHDVVQYIVSVKPELLNHRSEGFLDGSILFCAACASGNIETVKLLAEKGMDINAAVCLKDGTLKTPLAASCENRHLEVIKYLLFQHADVTKLIIDQFSDILAPLFQNMRKELTYGSSSEMINIQNVPVKNHYKLSWNDKNLNGISEKWFSLNANNILSIDLFHNKLTELPNKFFELVPNLEYLDVSMNCLTSLPHVGLGNSKLSILKSSRNMLHKVPIELFENASIQQVDLSQNNLRYLPPNNETEYADLAAKPEDDRWTCTCLRILKLSNNHLVKLPLAMHGASKLEKLIIADNALEMFITPWICPMDDLDLSGNLLTTFDSNVEIYWSKTLTRLNLSRNQIRSISWNICHLENLAVLDMGHNQLVSLPPQYYWEMKSLNKLVLSHNKLSASCGPDGFADVEKQSLERAISIDEEPYFVSNCEFPVDCFKNSLLMLDLSHNNLEMVPVSVCSLSALGELILSDNPNLHRLPAELGKLRNIWNLRLENIQINDLPAELTGTKSARKILAYLRAKLRKSVPFKRMKLMAVGLPGRGKTSLLATLQGRKPPVENVATVGICVEQWVLRPANNQWKIAKLFSSTQEQEIIFSTWDLAGQHVYYSTHQCFLTSNTLYLVVWNVEHGQEGIDGLAPWLLNIQARAPNSQVIVVGTHVDRLVQAKKKEQLHRLESEIFRKFLKKGFPIISGNVFVSNSNNEGVAKLKEIIYKVGSKMQDSNLHEPMIGKKVPLSYLQLYDAVTEEAEKKRNNIEAPILTTEQFLYLAKKNPDNDILDADELMHAAKFLHDHGILLHYDDSIRGLNNLFFIDPSWLCDMIALLITVKEKNPFIKNGYIKAEDAVKMLNDPRLPTQFIPQFLQILERFEIALRLDNEKILIPSMLPKDRPATSLLQMFQNANSESMSNKSRLSKFLSIQRCSKIRQNGFEIECIIRNYHISYIPAGFWSRLIARIIIAVNKWGMIINEQEPEEQPSTNEIESDNKKGVTIAKNYSMLFWRQGILVTYDGGSFLVESFKDNYSDLQYGNEGVTVTIWSAYGDFSVMGFIVDQIDRLISEWYPGLEDLDEFGQMTVQRMIPCPFCIAVFKQQQLSQYIEESCRLFGFLRHLRNPDYVYQFSLSACAVAALNRDKISCGKHPEELVSLSDLVPDLFLSDLPCSLVLDRRQLDFQPTEENRLGVGGAGEVYKALYHGKPLAIKRFYSARFSRNHKAANEQPVNSQSSSYALTPDHSIGDQLEDYKVVRMFWELRQEVAVLCRLQNPFIIGFLGICRSPICFGLELAPRGSLYPILEEIAHERDKLIHVSPNDPPIMDSVLGRKLTYKIALQVAHALMYLHDSEIIYRDLKSDNILVWTLDEGAAVNVKLSDYGISCFATPQGVLGEGGTPGFQAPEVKFGCPYDEKVDIFSYGIWLFELITGYRPYREHKTSAEIRKAVYTGARPSLKSAYVDSQLPYIEMLMRDCWRENPENRLSSQEVVQRLEDPKFFCLTNSYPKEGQSSYEHLTCLFPLANTDEGNRLLLWCGDGEDRKCVIIDADTGGILSDLSLPGHRVACAVQIRDRIWFGTEGCQIDVFGRHLWQIPNVLWTITTKDAVMDLLVKEQLEADGMRVFIALANGTLQVLEWKESNITNQRPNLLRCESEEQFHSHMKLERDEWQDLTVINLATEGRPAKSMAFTKGGSELWIASGVFISIVDVANLQLIEQIKVFALNRYMITQLVSDGDRLWSTDRRSAIMYQWDVEKRKRTFRFDCELFCDATRVVLAQPVTERLWDETRDCLSLRQEDMKMVKAANQDIANSQRQVMNVINASTKSIGATCRSQPSLMFTRGRRKNKEISKTCVKDPNSRIQTRPRSTALTSQHIRLASILLVDNTVWVGRSTGDILVINVRKPTSTSIVNSFSYTATNYERRPSIFGEVLTQLSYDMSVKPNIQKEISSLKCLGDKHLIAAFRLGAKTEPSKNDLHRTDSTTSRETLSLQGIDEFRFLIFQQWGLEQFETFFKETEDIYQLEEKA